MLSLLLIPRGAPRSSHGDDVLGYYLLIKPMRRKNIGECCPGQSLGFLPKIQTIIAKVKCNGLATFKLTSLAMGKRLS